MLLLQWHEMNTVKSREIFWYRERKEKEVIRKCLDDIDLDYWSPWVRRLSHSSMESTLSVIMPLLYSNKLDGLGEMLSWWLTSMLSYMFWARFLRMSISAIAHDRWYLVDRWGRRLILISGGIIMAIALSMISYFIYLDISITPQMVVLFVIIFNAFFGYSWGIAS